MKKIAALTLSLFLTVGTALADTPKDTPKDADAQPAKPATPAKPKAATKADKSDSAIAAEIEELRQALQAQQEQLTLLKEELAKRDRQIDEARDAAAAANARAAEATTKATEAVNTTAAVKSTTDTLNNTVADLSASNAALKTTVATSRPPQADASKPSEEGPASIRYKGVTITPGGFVAAETVYRTRATDSDIATPFTATPFDAANLAHVTENNFTGRQSRLSMLVQSKVGSSSSDWLLRGAISSVPAPRPTIARPIATSSASVKCSRKPPVDNGLIITGGQHVELGNRNQEGHVQSSGRLADDD